MSSRALRRREREQLNDPLPSSSSDDELVTLGSRGFQFAMLVESSESDGSDGLDGTNDLDGSNESDRAETQSDQAIQQKDQSRNVPESQFSESGQPKLKSADRKLAKPQPEEDIDEFLDRLVLEKKKERREIVSKDYTQSIDLFKADLDHLDASLELRRKVGGVDIDKDTHSELPDMAPAMAQRVAVQLRKQTRRHKKQLIVPRATWTKVTSALVELRLEAIPDHDLYGSRAFQFVPKPSYDKQFEEFVMLVETGDIDSIYAFVRKYPLHVDALLVVSDFLRMTSTSDASELTERALYILEKCTLATQVSGVDLTAGSLRLPYDEFDNRRMHLALIRYIQFLTKKGCYRTALEFSKILWSLDPLVDPVGVRMLSDFLAIQSGQYDWFEQVYEEIIAESPWMAGWHFSNALLKHIQDDPGADLQLQNAMVESPWMVPRLAECCGVRIDEEAWLVSHELPKYDHIKSLRDAMAKTYAQRCGPLWKSPKHGTWLESNIGIVLSNRLANPEAFQFKDYRPELAEVLAVFRHTLVSDLNVQVVLPPSIGNGPMRLYDPLPPEALFAETKPKCVVQ
ncbi:putative transcription factor [Paramicrosporidium saccamoebae]|uniref:Putative transcription factor n=1 Tax=Paramicrosporidium saccamoebae TaxID=1246581 RepID=A0A2H9TPK1_9FUNG|nr:putative transcription factor [Paramicrosporidium saccamoebae]